VLAANGVDTATNKYNVAWYFELNPVTVLITEQLAMDSPTIQPMSVSSSLVIFD
jgi:hypothetical protein